jgi:tRNA-2-methylthio-N6-dimethylallyladenosine synthase
MTALPPPAPGAPRQVYIETYGCQMNMADSELVARLLLDAGYALASTPETADVILLNTCAVRAHAEERVLGRAAQLGGLRQSRPGLVVGLLGCMAQHLGAQLAQRAPGVDLVAGPDAYRHLPELLARQGARPRLDVRLDRHEIYAGVEPLRRARTSAWVTVIRGCDRFCSYCVVPLVRGRQRCVPPDQILRQTEAAVAAGYREITLLGQTVNSYRHESTSFAALLRQVARTPGVARVRFMSPHPADFDAATIAAMAEEPAVCAGLHLPVQSGSDAQLALMRRDYDSHAFRQLVGQLRAAMPNLTLTTDVITGFCGETEADFAATVALLEQLRFDAAFMFRYSARPGTRAHKQLADDVPESVKVARLERVIELQERISSEINQTYVGAELEVMVEGESRRSDGPAGRYYGRTEGGKVVVFPQPADPNSIVRVCVSGSTSHTLFGELGG